MRREKKWMARAGMGALMCLCLGTAALGAQTEELSLPQGVRVDVYTPYTQVTVEYPVLESVPGVDSQILERVNSYFYQNSIADGDEQAAYAQQDREAILEYNPEMADTITYETTVGYVYLEGMVFSVRQDSYTYTGGAHGYGMPFGTSFDLTTGGQMTMGQLLGCDEQTAQEAVVEAYRQEIIGQVENITEESIRGSFDQMDYWMEADGMHVNIPPYVIASYAAGQQEAVVTDQILQAMGLGAQTQTVPGDTGSESGGDGSSGGASQGISQGEALPGGSGSTGEEYITVIAGISAPASDFILPYSSQRLMTAEDLKVLEGATVEEEHYKSQLAINEILARYGYVFDPTLGGSALEAYQKFEGKDWYEAAKPYCPSTSSTDMLYTYITELELDNVDVICQWQQEHGCYY